MSARMSDWSREDAEPVAFDVPARGCDFQWLTLRGLPGEYPQPLRITIDSVVIKTAAEAP
jgi:hypothetical protein